jgi:hypothetical protein
MMAESKGEVDIILGQSATVNGSSINVLQPLRMKKTMKVHEMKVEVLRCGNNRMNTELSFILKGLR